MSPCFDGFLPDVRGPSRVDFSPRPSTRLLSRVPDTSGLGPVCLQLKGVPISNRTVVCVVYLSVPRFVLPSQFQRPGVPPRTPVLPPTTRSLDPCITLPRSYPTHAVLLSSRTLTDDPRPQSSRQTTRALRRNPDFDRSSCYRPTGYVVHPYYQALQSSFSSPLVTRSVPEPPAPLQGRCTGGGHVPSVLPQDTFHPRRPLPSLRPFVSVPVVIHRVCLVEGPGTSSR